MKWTFVSISIIIIIIIGCIVAFTAASATFWQPSIESNQLASNAQIMPHNPRTEVEPALARARITQALLYSCNPIFVCLRHERESTMANIRHLMKRLVLVRLFHLFRVWCELYRYTRCELCVFIHRLFLTNNNIIMTSS